MKFVGKAFSLVGLYIIWSGSFGQNRMLGLDWSIMLMAIAFGTPVLLFGLWMTQSHQEAEQVVTNEKASYTISNPQSRDFALYLRSFSIDEKFIADKSYMNLFVWDQYSRPGLDPLERILADALKKTISLIGLNDDGKKSVGLGKAGLFDDWQTKIRECIGLAKVILLVPSASEGTSWEIGEIIRQNVLAKTIFIMPPDKDYMIHKTNESYQCIWENVRGHIKTSHKLLVPSYDSRGCIFFYISSFNEPTIFRIGSMNPSSLARPLKRAMRLLSRVKP